MVVEIEDEGFSQQACPPPPFVLASRVGPGRSVHESKEHGFRLTVQDGSLERTIGPIKIQECVQVIKDENDGQSYLVKAVVDSQPSGAKIPDIKPLLMDLFVEDTSLTPISKSDQCLVLARKEGAEGWRKVKSKVRTDPWGTYMRAAVSDIDLFTWGRIIPNDLGPLEPINETGLIEVQNGTNVEMFLVLVPVSFDPDKTSHVTYTGYISSYGAAAAVAAGVGGGSDHESEVKSYLLRAGFKPEHGSVAEGGTLQFLPPSEGSGLGRLLVGTISEECHAGIAVKVVVLYASFCTPVGQRRVILPGFLKIIRKMYATLGPGDIMASLGSEYHPTTNTRRDASHGSKPVDD